MKISRNTCLNYTWKHWRINAKTLLWSLWLLVDCQNWSYFGRNTMCTMKDVTHQKQRASNVWLLVATNTFCVSRFTQFHTTQWALAAPFMQTTISCSNLLATRAIAQRFLIQHCIWLVTNFTLQLPGTTHSGDRQYLFFHLFIYFPYPLEVSRVCMTGGKGRVYQ